MVFWITFGVVFVVELLIWGFIEYGMRYGASGEPPMTNIWLGLGVCILFAGVFGAAAAGIASMF